MAEIDFTNLSPEGWLEALPTHEHEIIYQLLGAGKTKEQIAELWLNEIGSNLNVGFGATESKANYFSNFRTEMDAFICGDKRYENERAKVSSLLDVNNKKDVVLVLAAILAPKTDLAVVAIVPVLALMLSIIGKMGVSAYCKTRQQA